MPRPGLLRVSYRPLPERAWARDTLGIKKPTGASSGAECGKRFLQSGACANDQRTFSDRVVQSPIPLVTLIMPAHNHALFVEAALKSIAAQTHSRIELIVIDDGSTDDTVEVISRCLARLGRTMRVEFHCQPNHGLGHTLARALRMAQGDFVQFLASDDALFPTMTARLVKAFLSAGPEVAAISCDGYVFDGIRGPHLPFHRLHPTPFSRNQHRELMAGNWLPAMGLLYRRDILMREGGIDPDLAYEDWGMLLTLTRRHRIVQIPDRLFLYRQHGLNTSADKGRMRAAQQALNARFPLMAKARALRAALAARDLRGVLAGLTPRTLGLGARFLLRRLQQQLGPLTDQPFPGLRRQAGRAGRVIQTDAGRIEIGPGTTIHRRARLEPGPGTLILGPGCHIGAGVRLTAGPGLTIGARTFIEAGAQIGGPERPTRIGRACLITAASQIEAGSDLGEMCVTMPGDRIKGTYPDGCWVLPLAQTLVSLAR